MSQDHPYVSHLTLADTPNAVPWARRHTAEILIRWRIPGDVVETAKLIVSELTTNAVRHPADNGPRGPGHPSPADVGTFTLAVQLTNTGLLIQVEDRDPRPPTRRVVGVDATGGRGLFLVNEMANSWGHYPTPTGKIVWATLLPHSPSHVDRVAETNTWPARDGHSTRSGNQPVA